MKRTKTLIILAVVLVAFIAAIIVVKSVEKHVDKLTMVDEVILTTSADNVTALSWKTSDGALDFIREDGIWYSADDRSFPVDQEKIAEFLSKYEEVHASFIIDDIEDYSQYGLSDPKCTVTITSGASVSEVTMGNFSSMDSKRYISTGDGRAFLINDDLYSYITVKRDDFMKHDVIPAIETVESFSLSGASELSAVYEPDAVYSYTNAYNYYTADSGRKRTLSDSLVENFLKKLSSLSLTEYVTYNASSENLADFSLKSPMLTVSVSGYNTLETDSSSKDAEPEKEHKEYTVSFGYVSTGTDDNGNETGDTYVRVGNSEIIYKLPGSTYESFSSVGYNTLRPTNVLTLTWDFVTQWSTSIDGEEHMFSIIKLEEGAETSGEEGGTSEGSGWADEDQDGIVYVLDGSFETDFSAVVSAIDALQISEFSDDEPSGELELSFVLYVSDNTAYSPVTVDIYRFDGDSCFVKIDSESIGLMPRSLMVDLREALTSVILNSQAA